MYYEAYGYCLLKANVNGKNLCYICRMEWMLVSISESSKPVETREVTLTFIVKILD